MNPAHSFVKELKRRFSYLDRSPSRRLALCAAVAFVGPDRMEADILGTSVGRVVNSNVNVPFAFRVFYSRDPELSEDDCAVGRWCAPALYQILFDDEVSQLSVG